MGLWSYNPAAKQKAQERNNDATRFETLGRLGRHTSFFRATARRGRMAPPRHAQPFKPIILRRVGDSAEYRDQELRHERGLKV